MTQDKINIAELLKDCPRGMELDCTIYNDVTFLRIDEVQNRCYFKAGPADTFWTTCEGRINGSPFGKCVIFPKGKTTWEGFVPPCRFKDGDVVVTRTKVNTYISIFKGYYFDEYYTYVDIGVDYDCFYCNKSTLVNSRNIVAQRLATEDEKQKLFDAIKANGYKWNAETKTLEKLVEPKFDITTLKPFDRVLVRQNNNEIWGIDLFGFYDEGYYHTAGNCIYVQCVPYKQNEHLLGKTDDCDEFYKTWE